MTTISIHKHTAFGVVVAYTWFIVALTATWPMFTVWISLATEFIYLLYELAFGCWPQQPEGSHQRAGEPTAQVTAVTPLKTKVGKDADETGNNDEKKSHHHNSSLYNRHLIGRGYQ